MPRARKQPSPPNLTHTIPHDPPAKLDFGGRSWYVIRVSPPAMMEVRNRRTNGTRYVRRAIDRLERMGCRPFLPVTARWQLRSRYGKEKDPQRVTRPLMPGYLLIDPPEPVNWMRINDLEFVLGVVTMDGDPVRVSAARDLRGTGDDKRPPIPHGFGFVLAQHSPTPDEAEIHMPTNRVYSVGDRVEFTDTDAWGDQDIRVVAINGARVKLEVALLGTLVEMDADGSRVAKAAD